MLWNCVVVGSLTATIWCPWPRIFLPGQRCENWETCGLDWPEGWRCNPATQTFGCIRRWSARRNHRFGDCHLPTARIQADRHNDGPSTPAQNGTRPKLFGLDLSTPVPGNRPPPKPQSRADFSNLQPTDLTTSLMDTNNSAVTERSLLAEMRSVSSSDADSRGYSRLSPALQLLSHPEGCGSLGAGSDTSHLGRLGRSAHWTLWFARPPRGLPGTMGLPTDAIRRDGKDPSDFTVALETIAVKAFGDMGPNARTRFIRDRFIAGHPDCYLRWHLDSVPPDTPIRDIVDRCRVCESHADTYARRVAKPTPEKARPVCVVSEPTFLPTEQVVAAITDPSVRLADLETMLIRLHPAIPTQALSPLSALTDLKTMLKCLLPVVPAHAPSPRSASQPRYVPTDIEAMLKRLLPGTPTRAPQPRPVAACRPRGG